MSEHSPKSARMLGVMIEGPTPNPDIYNIDSRMVLPGGMHIHIIIGHNTYTSGDVLSLDTTNACLQTTFLKNTHWIIGVIGTYSLSLSSHSIIKSILVMTPSLGRTNEPPLQNSPNWMCSWIGYARRKDLLPQLTWNTDDDRYIFGNAASRCWPWFLWEHVEYSGAPYLVSRLASQYQNCVWAWWMPPL